MMILPLADALQNCLQNLTSRIAGIDNEQMTGRVMSMGAMLGFGIGTIKEQFKSPSSNTMSNNSGNGFKGFINRAKSVINPGMNLSDEKDYSGNVNPIRDVLPKEKVKEKINNNSSTPTSSNTNRQNNSNNTVNASDIARGALNVTKSYLSFGAKMAEGNFNNSPYKTNKHGVSSNLNNTTLQDTEYINKIAENSTNENNIIKKLGDSNEPKE